MLKNKKRGNDTLCYSIFVHVSIAFDLGLRFPVRAARINEIEALGERLMGKFGTPNGLYNSQARGFFKSVLNADPKVLDLLEQGIKLDTKNLPSVYVEVNNRSAREKMSFCLEKTLEYVKKGSVTEIAEKATFTNPLSVASKEDYETSSTKFRMVIDLSRSLNLYQPDKKYRPEDLDKLESIFRQGDYCTTMDLRSAYHHIRINPDMQQYFGFQIFDYDLCKFRFFQFCCMPFGFSPAGYLLSRVTNPIMRFCRSLGIRLGIFVDDVIVLGYTYEECKAHSEFVKKVFLMSGFAFSVEKCRFEPSQTTTYQGLVLNFEKFTYSIPPKKLDFILDNLDRTLRLACEGTRIKAKELASIIGKVLSIRKARGASILVGLRHNQHVLARAVLGGGGIDAEPNWNCQVRLDQQCIEEWRYIRRILIRVVERRIPCAEPRPVFTLDKFVHYDKPDFEIEDHLRVMASDASEAAAFIYEAERFSIVQEFHFTDKEKSFGSGRRELLSISKTLLHRGEDFRGAGQVYWITDSKNVFYFLKRGSRHAWIQREVMGIKIAELNLGCEIIPVWQPRTQYHMVLADLGSKLFASSDEWSIDKASFRRICHSFGIEPTIDGFATRENSLLPRFYSKIPQVGTQGVNFFTVQLSCTEIYWLQPPVDMLSKVIGFILQSKKEVLAIISFPEWPLAPFWPMVVRGRRFAPFVRAAVYTNPFYIKFNDASNLFTGRKKFRHISILVNTRFLNNNLEYIGPESHHGQPLRV